MAVDISKNVFELFSGRKRTRLLPTLAIAVLVTSVVVIPLTFRAIEAKNNPTASEAILAPADAQLVLVDQAFGDPVPLDGAVIAEQVLISIVQQDASAVSFNLFAAGADVAAVESRDAVGPQFDFVVGESGTGRPFDTKLLLDGEYELFLTIQTPTEDRRTAVSFEIDNS